MPFSPADISNGKLWVPVDALTGFSNNDPVMACDDAFGLNDLVAEGFGPPTYKTNAINGLPILRYTSARLAKTGFNLSQPFSFIIVASSTATNPGGWFGGSSSPQAIFYTVGSTDLHAGTSLLSAGSGPYLSGVIWSGVADGSFSYYRQDGSPKASGNIGTGGITNFQLGSVWGGTPLTADIGEVIIYSADVGTDAIQSLEGYSAWKWGMVGNLPVDHPYKSSPPGTGGGSNAYRRPAMYQGMGPLGIGSGMSF